MTRMVQTVVGRTDTAAFQQSSSAEPTHIKHLRRGLRGDLDNIVLTAQRKDPLRRYTSAEQLADDIRRYQHDQPVSAHADMLRYRASKFVTRNRWAVGLATLTGACLISGIAVTTHQANIVRQAQARAEQNAVDMHKLDNDSLFGLH